MAYAVGIMVIGPARCAICGAPGDVWNYGLVTGSDSNGVYWEGVVCDRCVNTKNKVPYGKGIVYPINEAKTIENDEDELDDLGEALRKLGLDGIIDPAYNLEPSRQRLMDPAYNLEPLRQRLMDPAYNSEPSRQIMYSAAM